MDIEQILKDLQLRAETAVKDFDVDTKVESAKDTARKVKERLETDEQARNLTIGGGVLLAGLLATSGGRRLLGTVAKTGAVAGLGALAYKAWQERNNAAAPSEHEMPEAEDIQAAGFVIDAESDPAFARALVHAMATAAYADGVIDPEERAAIDGVVETDDQDLMALVDNSKSEDDCLDMITLAARTPNHASQLYAAAAIATGDQSASEAGFLNRLAERLGIAKSHAAAIGREIASS
ncbi:MAG: DUF533 domain-containing protein [Pseudomonadota bacterium]